MDADTRELLLTFLAVIGSLGGALLGAWVGGTMSKDGAREAIREQFALEERKSLIHVLHRMQVDVASIQRITAVLENRERPDDKIASVVHEECAAIASGYAAWRHELVYIKDDRVRGLIALWYDQVRMAEPHALTLNNSLRQARDEEGGWQRASADIQLYVEQMKHVRFAGEDNLKLLGVPIPTRPDILKAMAINEETIARAAAAHGTKTASATDSGPTAPPPSASAGVEQPTAPPPPGT